MKTMDDLMAEYEADLIAKEQAERPAYEARRAAMIQQEIDAGLRDEDGLMILPEIVEDDDEEEDEDEEDDE